MCTNVKNTGIFIILDLLNNSTKFQLNWIRTLNLQLHLIAIAVWPRSLQVVWTGKAQWVMPSSQVWHLRHLWCLRKSQCKHFQQAQKETWLPPKHQSSPLNTNQSHTNYVVHDLFSSNHTMFKLHMTRIKNMQFAVDIFILTHLWPWNKVKVIKPRMTM